MEKGNWSVEIWGCRGSYSRPEGRFLKYGGNTSCVSLVHGGGIVVLDAGSGLAGLGRKLKEVMSCDCDGTGVASRPGRETAVAGRDKREAVGHGSLDAPSGRVDILLSHLHLDHVQGLPMFLPFYDAEMEIHLYGMAGDRLIGFEQCLKTLVGPPYWPVGFSDFAAEVHFHELRAGETFFLNGLAVATMAGNHPGGSLLYRIDEVSPDGESPEGAALDSVDPSGVNSDGAGLDGANPGGGKRSLVYALDCETDERVSRELAEFAKEADFLLWDAGFTAEDMKPGWGHSTWEQGVEMRCAARAKNVVMMHYNAEYDDVFLQRLEKAAKSEDKAVVFAREGMRLC